MATYQVVTFQDIYTAVLEELKVPLTDTTTLNRVKRNINAIYLNEILPAHNWKWARSSASITHKAAYNYSGTDTAIVTAGSTTVTLSTAPSSTLGSFAGFIFQADEYDERYLIASHTAGSATLTLKAGYTGTTNSAANFKIWSDLIELPTDAAETLEMTHAFHTRPMQGVGPDRLKELQQMQPQREDYPKFYSTAEYQNGTVDGTRYLVSRIWPSFRDADITINVDYKLEGSALSLDADEPLLPTNDRMVLVYGALRQSWIRERDPEVAAENAQLYANKLSQMVSMMGDSTDMPRLQVDSVYLSSKRNTIGRTQTR